MAKNVQFNGMAKLLAQFVVMLVAVVVAWSFTSHQVVDNTEDIEKLDVVKLDKQVFQMYIDQRQEASEKTDKMLDKIDSKLDQALSHEHAP